MQLLRRPKECMVGSKNTNLSPSTCLSLFLGLLRASLVVLRFSQTLPA